MAAKNFGQRPCDLFGFDLDAADPDLLKDFDLTCSLRLALWDAYVAEKQAEAIKDAQRESEQQAQAPVTPELLIQQQVH